ncbi:MAG: class I SAM-dependent RNA methyltransferase [Longimicrobiales bacterium]|nr:class I SAM-dependent RNA methyltransferase [Longimicrobiales bacterium]
MALGRLSDRDAPAPVSTPRSGSGIGTGLEAGYPGVEIHDLSAEGQGVGRLPDGRAVFVAGALPGERVSLRVVRERPRYANGELERVLSPSADRRDPRCPLFGACGGCQLQHLRYRAQLAWKGRRIAEALRRLGGIAVEAPAVEPSPSEWRYRNRMSFTLIRLPGGRVVAGLHRAGRPGSLVEVRDECLLPEAEVLPVWTALRTAWGRGARLLPPGPRLRLTLRRAGAGAALVVEGGDPGGDASALLAAVPGLVAIAHRPRGGALTHLAGEADVRERWFGEEVPVASEAFLQVNREAGEALHVAVLRAVGAVQGLRVVDAYCGVGAYGRRLARQGATVTGIELDAAAVAAARREAPPGLQVLEGRVEARLAECLPADRMILNPPRSGLDPAVPELMRERPAARVVYVSCDPATLARDLARLGPAYRVGEVRGFDLFPQTPHVETVVVLERRSV